MRRHVPLCRAAALKAKILADYHASLQVNDLAIDARKNMDRPFDGTTVVLD